MLFALFVVSHLKGRSTIQNMVTNTTQVNQADYRLDKHKELAQIAHAPSNKHNLTLAFNHTSLQRGSSVETKRRDGRLALVTVQSHSGFIQTSSSLVNLVSPGVTDLTQSDIVCLTSSR